MTDQNKPNSTSGELPEPVTEFTLCDNFIRQYKKFKLGMLEGEFFTIREQQALTASCIGTPDVMQAFLANTVHIVTEKAKEEFPVQEELMECVAYFNSAIYGVIFHVVVPLLKLPEEQKIALRENYMRKIEEAKKGTEAPFDGLDFDMPNIMPGNPDTTPNAS